MVKSLKKNNKINTNNLNYEIPFMSFCCICGRVRGKSKYYNVIFKHIQQKLAARCKNFKMCISWSETFSFILRRDVKRLRHKMKILTFVATLVVNFFVIVEAAEESSVTVNLRNSVNEISDKFISYEIDFYKLMEAVTDRQPFTILSPSYVKLGNFIKFLRDDSTDGQVRDVISIFQSFE